MRPPVLAIACAAMMCGLAPLAQSSNSLDCEKASESGLPLPTTIPPERLADYIRRFLDNIRTRGTEAGIYAHASVGCLHVRPVVNLKTEAACRAAAKTSTEGKEYVVRDGDVMFFKFNV